MKRRNKAQKKPFVNRDMKITNHPQRVRNIETEKNL